MRGISRVLVAIAMIIAAPAFAADEEEVGILAALGLTAASGNTEVSEKGAEIEGWLLASGTLAKAAKAIAAKKGHVPSPIILLAGDAKFDLGAYTVATGNIAAAMKAMDDVGSLCTTGPLATAAADGEKDARVAAAIIGALKVDTKITGFDIGTPNAALLNLIAGHLTSEARIPTDAIGVIDPDSILAKAFGGMVTDRASLQQCSKNLPNTSDAEKKAKAKVDGAIAAATGVETALTAFDKDAGASLLNRALLAEPYLSGKFGALRVNIEKSGGNLITRKNIFLQFGFPGALSVSAATIVSYRYYDPATGTIYAAGMLVCQSPERSWHTIQAGKRDAKDCVPA